MRCVSRAAGSDQSLGMLDAQRASRFSVMAAELERALEEPRCALERQALNRAVAALFGCKRGALQLARAFVAGGEQLRVALVARLESARERGVELRPAP